MGYMKVPNTSSKGTRMIFGYFWMTIGYLSMYETTVVFWKSEGLADVTDQTTCFRNQELLRLNGLEEFLLLGAHFLPSRSLAGVVGLAGVRLPKKWRDLQKWPNSEKGDSCRKNNLSEG